MTEEQIPLSSPNPPKPSNRKWIAVAIGGGCALIACIVAAAAIAIAVLAPVTGKTFSSITVIATPTLQASNPSTTPQISIPSNVVVPQPRQHPQANANAMGDPNAPVKIIEYADFQCPYCLRYWEQTEPQIIQAYIATGKVYYEYRSVGAFIGPDSASAAEAAYCAGDQNQFWNYHDVLYANWTGENAGDFSADRLKQYASLIGLNLDQFESCLANGNHADQVNQDVADAKADGIRATPSFLINGQLLEGAQPFSAFQQMIDAALQGH